MRYTSCKNSLTSGEGEERNDPVPVALPALGHGRETPSPLAAFECAQRQFCRLGIVGPLIGYARVSKAAGSQSLDLQRDALRAEGIDDPANLYHDFASGVRHDWPGLDRCLRALRKDDVFVIWKLDLLGRNLAHLAQTVQDLSARDVGLRRTRRSRRADRHHHRGRPPRVRHLRGAGRVRTGIDP